MDLIYLIDPIYPIDSIDLIYRGGRPGGYLGSWPGGYPGGRYGGRPGGRWGGRYGGYVVAILVAVTSIKRGLRSGGGLSQLR